MVMTLAIPIRKFYGLEDFITMRHLQNMGKVMLATGLIVAYGYLMETFIAWYSGNATEQFMILNRMHGPYAPMYWSLILCNIAIPQLLWIPKVRHTAALLVPCSRASMTDSSFSASTDRGRPRVRMRTRARSTPGVASLA